MKAVDEKLKMIPDRSLYLPIKKRLHSMPHCIAMNANLLLSIVAFNRQAGFAAVATEEGNASETTVGDMDKVRSTLRQFARDWSVDGATERSKTYDPILRILDDHFKHLGIEDKGDVRVLVPGAGLCRLVYEIVSRGYSCQGNEFSMFMLLASNYVLNGMKRANQFKMYPWVHSFSNVASQSIQMKEVMIPDVLVETIPSTADFSMAAGDFLQVYAEAVEEWDVVVTCFFIDTAKDMAQYISLIAQILKPGGVWINLGPLLYHFEGMPNEISIEFTLEEVRDLVLQSGFTFESESTLETTYCSNSCEMLKYLYQCVLWKCVKK